MYEFETMIATYTAIVVSVIISLYVNQRNLSRIDENLELSRKNLDEMRKNQLISTYPFLSQKIGKEDPRIYIAGEESHPHFILYIKNFGKGPAVNQDSVTYEFYQGENQIHQRRVPITGAHDIISPDDERPLDMTDLSEGEWNPEIERRYDTIWVRLPHEDIQRNRCCNCTRYLRQPQIIGGYGKVERHWYFSAIPEISSERCEECEWRNI